MKRKENRKTEVITIRLTKAERIWFHRQQRANRKMTASAVLRRGLILQGMPSPKEVRHNVSNRATVH